MTNKSEVSKILPPHDIPCFPHPHKFLVHIYEGIFFYLQQPNDRTYRGSNPARLGAPNGHLDHMLRGAVESV
jgi:hypothetical protein